MRNWSTGNGGGKFGMRNWGAGDERVRHCVSGAVFCLGSRLVFAFLSRRCPRARLALRFCCGAFPRFTPVFFLLEEKETACGILRSYSAGRDRHSCVLAVLFGYLPRLVHFGFGCFFVAISTGYEGRSYEGHGARGWRRGACTSLRNRIGFAAFSAGSTLGLRAPDCAKESSTLWTLLTLRRGWVGACSRHCRLSDSLHGAGRRGNAEWLFSNSNSAFGI